MKVKPIPKVVKSSFSYQIPNIKVIPRKSLPEHNKVVESSLLQVPIKFPIFDEIQGKSSLSMYIYEGLNNTCIQFNSQVGNES